MKILVPGLVVFAVWCMISIQWYVCGIYELCQEEEVPNIPAATSPLNSIADEVLTEHEQPPLAFEWSGADPIVNEEFDLFRDSIKTIFDKSPEAVVEITGLFDPQELNNTDFENLGLARAEEIRRLLLNSGIKRIYSVKSGSDDLSAGLAGNIANAYEFRLVSMEKKTAGGFIISEGKNRLAIHFPEHSARPESDKQVQLALKHLAESANKGHKKLLVTGHTDNWGEALDNKKLGLVRAASVKDILVSYGMEEKNVLAESEGEEMPLVSNSTPQGRQQNRRVEIVII